MQHLTIPTPAPVRAVSFPIDNTRQPSGRTVGVDARSLLLDGRRWMPVMGELHYARVPAETWRDELLKLRAGGISCVATYVFWIHHEEVRGRHRWDAERNLRRFVETAREVGLEVVVRLGPWCHGEVRNGGLPEWVVAELPGARTDDPAYLAAARAHYAAIASQLRGLLWHEGGPIVAFQIENEFGGPSEHMLTLKRLAREVGLLAPLYTRTGWPDLATPMPFGELLPLYGAYAEGFWDRELTAMPNLYPAGFRFNALRTDSAIATDLLGKRDARDFDDPSLYPFLTCELGGGMMSSYHRRIRIDPRDIEAVALVKIGSGGNLPGYYMYHGGVNPEGEHTTLQETQATRYWNDLPVKNYDFQAPVGAAGQLREHYHRLRRLHLFVHTFGPALAGMPAAFPEERPTQREDTTTLRWSVRSDGRSGFAFLNNHERLRELPAKDVHLHLSLPGGEVTMPPAPVLLPSGACTIWPFNLELAAGVRLEQATAMPLCRIVTCATTTWFFAQTPGVPATFALHGAAPRTLTPGRGPALSLKDAEGEDVQIVLLDEADSLSLWKLPWLGSERVFLTRAGLTIDGDDLRLSSHWASELAVSVYPPLADGGPRDGVFEPLALERFTCGHTRVLVAEPVRQHGSVRVPPMGWTTPAVAVAPEDADFAAAAVWKLTLPSDLDTAATPLLRLRYSGDVLRVRLGGRLILDDFFNGDVVDLDLVRHAQALASGAALEIEVLPLDAEAPIHLPAKERPASGSVACALHSIELHPMCTARPSHW